MFRVSQNLLITLVLMCLLASFAAYAAPAYTPPYDDQSYGNTISPYQPTDPAQAHAQAAMAAQTAAAQQTAQTALNTHDVAQLQRMTGTQDFILRLTAIVMPLLIAMMTGLMLYIQIKQKAIVEANNIQQREDLILVARSVNGVKTELVAKAELAAFLEGLHMQNQGDQMTPSTEQRLAQLQETVRYATEKAEAAAASTVTTLVEKQNAKTDTLKSLGGLK